MPRPADAARVGVRLRPHARAAGLGRGRGRALPEPGRRVDGRARPPDRLPRARGARRGRPSHARAERCRVERARRGRDVPRWAETRSRPRGGSVTAACRSRARDGCARVALRGRCPCRRRSSRSGSTRERMARSRSGPLPPVMAQRLRRRDRRPARDGGRSPSCGCTADRCGARTSGSSCSSPLLEQPRAPPVRVDLAAGLTGGAVDDLVLGEVDALQRLAAARARLSGLAVHVVDAASPSCRAPCALRTGGSPRCPRRAARGSRRTGARPRRGRAGRRARTARAARRGGSRWRTRARCPRSRAGRATGCAAGPRDRARAAERAMSNASSSGSGPRPASSASSPSRRVQPDPHLTAGGALGDDELRPVLERHREHGRAGSLRAGLDERETTCGHQVHDQRRAVIGVEEHALGPPPGTEEPVAGEPGEGRLVGLTDCEVDERGRGDRGACDEGVERLGERLQLGQLGHLREVSPTESCRCLRPAFGRLTARRASRSRFHDISVRRHTFQCLSAAKSCRIRSDFRSGLHFFLDQASTLGTIAPHNGADVTSERLRERGRRRRGQRVTTWGLAVACARPGKGAGVEAREC